MRYLILLFLPAIALAGGNNPANASAVTIWSGQALTSTKITSTAFYPIGRDTAISAHITLTGLESTDSVTLSQVYALPGETSTYYQRYNAAADVVLVNGTDDKNQILNITFPAGAEKMFWTAQTSSSDGATITATVNGR